MIPVRRIALVAIGVAALTVTGAAAATTINLAGAGGTGGYGNSLHFSNSGIGVDVYAWAETGAEAPAGSGLYALQTAQIWSWATGLGICNSTEGLANSTCDNNEHEMDTAGRDDLMVFWFDQQVSFESLEITVDPYDGTGSDPNDRDLRYWVSTAASPPDLSANTFNTLSPTFGTGLLDPVSSSYGAYTHLLYGGGGGAITGNLLLISGNYAIRNCMNANVTSDMECEAYKVTNLTVSTVSEVVPIPAAAWMMLSALGCLGVLRRRLA